MTADTRPVTGRLATSLRWYCLFSSMAPAQRLPAADPAVPVCEPTITLLAEAVRDQDDLCVWRHPTMPASSTIITSDKSADLVFVYDLKGTLLQSLPVSKPGNIDIRQGVTFAGANVDIVVVNQRADGFRLAVFRVDRDRRLLERVDDGELLTGPNYGGCLFHSRRSGKCYFVSTSEERVVEQFEFFDNGNGRVSGRRVRHWPLGKCEGAAADDERGLLYITEEEGGVWQLGAEPDEPAPGERIIPVGENGIEGDLEGIACFRGQDGGRYLVFSDQGTSSFPVYRVDAAPEYVGRFTVRGAEDTDGIELAVGNLGPQFPQGLFACHSGQSPCPILLTPAERVFDALRIARRIERRP